MKLFLMVLVLALSACAKHPRYHADPLISVTMDDSVPDEQRDLLELDLKTASWAKIQGDNEADTIGLTDFSHDSLKGWLGDRVKAVVGEKFDQTAHLYGKQNFKYTPQVFEETVYLMMKNLGSGLYITGKSKKILLAVEVKGQKIILDSPRAGILQIGEGLFSQKTIGARGNKDNLASSFRRLQTLFHEARHSDGNGKDLAFQHVNCESGTYIGKPACDRFSNGPYTVGRIMLERFLPLCDECTESEKEGIEILIADLRTRILKKEVGDARPEKITP